MPTVATKIHHADVPVSVKTPLDRFCVFFGYKDRDFMQLRLEEDGMVYLSDCRPRLPGEDELLTALVPFEALTKAWPEFVTMLRDAGLEREK